jgi:DNA modification methylase
MQLKRFPNTVLASAKRTKNERKGVHSWHPYYAGYSETFVESALDYLSLGPKSLLLDPWSGSGTTLLVASRRGIKSIGFEINQAMNIFSLAKSSSIPGFSNEINRVSEIIIKIFIEQTIPIEKNDPLLFFMSNSLCSGVRGLFHSINQISLPNIRLNSEFRKAFSFSIQKPQPIKDFLLAALFISSRKLAGYKGGSNPTWLKTLNKKPIVKKITLANFWKQQIKLMLCDLEEIKIEPAKELLYLPQTGDSRKLPLKDSSIDGVITSPPYLTRIDYAMATQPELLILNNKDDFRKIRENTIGAPVIVDKSINGRANWGKLCNLVLELVENHSSKAAQSYYLPHMFQYFNAVQNSLTEIIRVLKQNKKALIVVQSSYFKEHEINLGEIYSEMGNQLNAKAKIISREIVRSHMAHINTKSNQYKSSKTYYEDVVEITKE